MVPMVVLSPVVGVLVDRSNRKLMMMVSDLAAALTTVLVLVLYSLGQLQIWHLYITATIAGIFQGFQWPAYSAAISVMLPKEQYARANGMIDLAGNASGILAPLLAGALIGPLGLRGLLIIDLCAAAVAVGTLFFVHIPQPTVSQAGREGQGSFFKEAAYGFRYIFARPSLLGLQIVFLVGNFFTATAFAVLAPMILARSGSNAIVFGSVQTAGAIGGVAGGLLLSAWGGFKRRIHGVLLGWFCSGLLGFVVMGLGQSLPVWIVGMVAMNLVIPILNGSNQAIWQAKVAPDVQGRVFATRRLIAWIVSPLSRLIAGPLVDQLLEPAMSEGGSLIGLFGPLVGTGAGSGMGLLFAVTGLCAAVVGLGGYLFPFIRNVETIIPDHDVPAATAAVAPEA